MKGYVEVIDRFDYQAWIDANVPSNGRDCIGRCAKTAKDMAMAFPELKVVGVCGIFGDGHAWCVTPDGKVVDPTAHQFQKPYIYEKEPLEEADFPGTCGYCGELILRDTPRSRAFFGPDEEYGPHHRCNARWEEECQAAEKEYCRRYLTKKNC